MQQAGRFPRDGRQRPFHRTSAPHRRDVDATLKCLARDGYHRASVRRIADTAGVTAGLLRYYFAGKTELLAQAYRQFRRDAFQVHLDDAMRAEPCPARRLEASVRSMLDFHAADRSRMNIWVSFLEAAITDPEISAAEAENHDLYIGSLSAWIADIHAERGGSLTPDEARRLAVGTKALIDGVWLECSLNPSRMTPDEALAIALRMIGAGIGVPLNRPPNP